MDHKRFFDRLRHLNRAHWLIFSLLAVMIIIIFCWASMSWRASSLARDLNEYVSRHNPLDEFGMTAKVSNSWNRLNFEILSQESTGKYCMMTIPTKTHTISKVTLESIQGMNLKDRGGISVKKATD